tara:strand:+ start:8618 stop:10477 length:1860 start_codon:yes stop_codon:yes gene_type:complete
MERNIIIDYLNISSAFKIIMNERSSNVTALFRSQSKLKELLLIKLIGLFRINYTLTKMTSSNFSDTLANDIFERTKHSAQSMSEEYLLNSSSQINNLLNFSLKSFLFHALWRQICILEYVKNSKIDEKFEVIYISSPINDKLLMESSYYKSIIKNLTVFHYKTSCIIDDHKYAFRRIQPKFKYFGKKISTVFEILYALFFINFKVRSSIEKIDLLIFSQFPEKWVGIDKIDKSTTLNSKIVYPDGMVGDDKNAFNIKSLNLKEFFLFYIYMLTGIAKFFWALNINSSLFYQLLINHKFAFILKSFYSKHNIRIVLSGYESPFCHVATAVASDHKEMVSFDCLWSLCDRPIELASTQQRMSDRYFLWGKWHHDLMKASNDKSGGHIIVGYVGDDLIPLMKTKAKKFRNFQLKKYNKIITVFDSGSGEDCHFSEEIYIDYIKAIIHTAKKFNALVVLKTKKGDHRYVDIIKSNDDGLLIHYEKGSLIAALGSDIVIGVASSSPGSISATHGAKTILYDPNNQVWNKWESYENSCEITRSIKDLKKMLLEYLSYDDSKETSSPKFIDPFADGKAQQRMENYIHIVFHNLHLGKNEALYLADDNFKKAWGDDKVILNKIKMRS